MNSLLSERPLKGRIPSKPIRLEPKPPKPHLHVIEKTYQNNLASDYTEQISALTKQFDYASNSQAFWGSPELSIFYGTPLYQQASETQKLTLNHLYWVAQYTHTANSEANTILYNRVTSGVFSHFSDYQNLVEELELESEQELTHIRAFQRIGYKTKMALMGKDSLLSPTARTSSNSKRYKSPRVWQSKATQALEFSTEAIFRTANHLLHWQNREVYSAYLSQAGRQKIPTTVGGLVGVTASPMASKLLTLNWGSSPFLAAQYYAIRMIANMSLKAYEHSYFKHFRRLKRCDEFIPIPTEISYCHLLDEAFHTTLSQLISQDLYRDFDQPSHFEKAFANSVLDRLQRGLLGGLSGGMMIVFREDQPFLNFYYRLLRSRVFEMSHQDALHWLDQILCQEHDGFHLNRTFHRNLLTHFQNFFGQFDYLTSSNRTMELMRQGASIQQALTLNQKSFQNFQTQITG